MKFSKNNIQDGDIVHLKNGKYGKVRNGDIELDDSYLPLTFFNETLEHINVATGDCDIVKIQRPKLEEVYKRPHWKEITVNELLKLKGINFIRLTINNNPYDFVYCENSDNDKSCRKCENFKYDGEFWNCEYAHLEDIKDLVECTKIEMEV